MAIFLACDKSSARSKFRKKSSIITGYKCTVTNAESTRILEAVEHIDSNPRFPLERVVSIRVFIQALNKCLCPLTVCL